MTGPVSRPTPTPQPITDAGAGRSHWKLSVELFIQATWLLLGRAVPPNPAGCPDLKWPRRASVTRVMLESFPIYACCSLTPVVPILEFYCGFLKTSSFITVLISVELLHQPLKFWQEDRNLYLFGLSLKSTMLSSWRRQEEIDVGPLMGSCLFLLSAPLRAKIPVCSPSREARASFRLTYVLPLEMKRVSLWSLKTPAAVFQASPILNQDWFFQVRHSETMDKHSSSGCHECPRFLEVFPRLCKWWITFGKQILWGDFDAIWENRHLVGFCARGTLRLMSVITCVDRWLLLPFLFHRGVSWDWKVSC